MEIVVVGLCVGLVILIAVQVAIFRRIDDVPLRVQWSLRDLRQKDEAQAMAALHAAAEPRAAALVAKIKAYHDKIAADLRGQGVDAEVRARVLERRVSDVGVALDTACALVTQARELTERLRQAAGERPPDRDGAARRGG